MYRRKRSPLFTILDESPFFIELTMKEREVLIRDLLKTYPKLSHHVSSDSDVGYEASWLMEQHR